MSAKNFHWAAAALLLAGCSTVYVPKLVAIPVEGIGIASGVSTFEGYQNAPEPVAEIPEIQDTSAEDIAKIGGEFARLAQEVASGRLTKVQAAQYLNRFRVELLGNNPVDDDVYSVYLRSAINSQRGVSSAEDGKRALFSVLQKWQQQWPNLTVKPKNPAFTNFLMQSFGLGLLQ